jgi:hypothetical protein
MTDFLITAPDGKKYKVSGADAAGAVAALQKHLGVQPAETGADRARMARAGTLPQPSPDALARTAAANQIGLDEMMLAQDPALLRWANKMVQGLPFVGEYADEAIGAIAGAVGGRDAGDAAMTRQRLINDAMDRQRPITSAALRTAGGIAGAIAIRRALPAVPALAGGTLFSKAITGLGIGAAVGGAEGAVSGYGAGEGEGRLREAASRGAVGAGLGGLVGAAVPAVSAAVKASLEAIKGRDVTVISRVLGIGKDAARVVKSSLEADDFVGAQAALKRAGADAVLADAGPASAQLLDTAAQAGGGALRVARTAVEGRAEAAGKRLTGILDGVLGAPQGVKANARAISQRTASIRGAAYDRAYSQPIDYAADAGRNIEGVLSRIPPKTMRAAVDEANDAMRAAGVKNRQIMATIADDGAVTFREMPNVQQLDELKKALGTIGQNETDAITGRVSGAGLRAKKLASELRDAVAEAVPSYRTAVKLGGDKIAEDAAMDIGRKLLLSGTTREQVADVMANASREARAAAKAGLRQYIDDTLANVQRTITDPNVDAREAMSAVKALSSRANKEKVRAVVGNGTDALFRQLDEVTAHLELRSAVARNSATAARTAGKAAIDQVAEPSAASELMRGSPAKAAQKAIQFFTGRTGEADIAAKQKVYEEIAQALTSIRGPEAQRALQTVQQAIAGQPVASADAARVGWVLSSNLGSAAYQATQQSRATQQRALPR